MTHYEQSLAISREVMDRGGEGGNLNNIGKVYAELDQNQKALSYYEQSLAISREIKDRMGEVTNLTNIGVSFREMEEYEKALAYFKQSLTICKEIGDRLGETKNLNNISGVYLSMEWYDKAEKLYSESLQICQEIGAPEFLGEPHYGLALVKAIIGKYNEAIKHFEQDLDTIEFLRKGITEKEDKMLFMQGKLGVYDQFIKLLKILHKNSPSKGYDKKAFEIFERKQGRTFLEEMGKSGARNYTGVSDDIKNKESELEGRLAKLQEMRTNALSKPEKDLNNAQIQEIDKQLAEIKSQQQSLQEKIRTEHPDYHALKYPKPATLAELQKDVLKSGEAMLIYGVMKDSLCLWVVDKKQFGFYPIKISEAELTEKVNGFKEITDLTNKNSFRRSGKDLYELLMPEKACEMIANAKTLYIIPTGSLYDLPFEALISKTDEKGNDRYLIEDYPVAYLSSASLLKTLRESQARKKEKAKYPLLAFAHPVYGTKEKPCFDSTRGDSSISEMRTRGYLDIMGGSFCELPDTETEAKEIMSILNAPEKSEPLQMRQAASRSNVFKLHESKQLDKYRYVVFSCHGILPGEVNQINQPALVLSQPDPSTKENGYLTMADVFGIRLNADMVTLSACNTGKGKAQKGEGVIGLTRAFMYAGTPAVSVTLWSVESKSAKVLSSGFYKNLNNGKTRAEALREIKLRMIRGEEKNLYQHPFFWAPVVVFGDGT